MSKNKKNYSQTKTAKPNKRTWYLGDSQPCYYRNPKTIRKLNFTDRLNTTYIVENQPIEELTEKDTMTYKDYIQRALDPNIDSNNNVYGIAKKLEPLTTRINRMKNNINSATQILKEYQAKQKQAIVEMEQVQQQEQVKQPEPQQPKEVKND